jgi:branched-chain amino acid aminotransferase
MHPFVYHNNRVLPLEQVRLSPGQAGLINGWGVFSTVRVYDGQPFALERHFQRLSRDAKLLEIPLPMEYARLHCAVMELIRANHANESCVRIYFIYNKIGIWRSDESFPTTDLVLYTIDVPERVGPTQLALVPNGRHAANPLTGTKVISWLNNVWTVETKAHHRGFDDVVLLNERNEVAECTAANLFCVKEGRISTPPLNSGCLAGVSRAILLEIAAGAGTPIAERALSVEELVAADEVFITSTTRQVQAVDRIEDHTYKVGPVTEKMAALFQRYVDDYIRAAAAQVVERASAK